MNISKQDAMHMGVAKVMAKQSTCLRKKVGCVITDPNGHILSTGYNGAPTGHDHCTTSTCVTKETCDAIHAEQNAIARLREPKEAWILYCTTRPCLACQKLISATAIQRVVYVEETDSPHFSNLYSLEQYNDTV